MAEIDMTADAAPELRRGDSGPWVKYLKQLLEHLGYEAGSINETFDATTENAVRAFQNYYNDLPDTGRADRATWERLVWRANQEERHEAAVARSVLAGGDLSGFDVDRALETLESSESNLEAGEQVGRKGWLQVDIHLSVHDHLGVPLSSGDVYARFTDKAPDAQTSDENSTITNGRCMFNDVWVPRSGWFHLFVDSQQRTPENEALGYIEGVASFECNSKTVVFEARQNDGPTFTVSESEARTRGWNKSWSKDVGGSIPIVGGPSFGGAEGTEQIDESTSESGKSLTFEFAGKGFASFAQND